MEPRTSLLEVNEGKVEVKFFVEVLSFTLLLLSERKISDFIPNIQMEATPKITMQSNHSKTFLLTNNRLVGKISSLRYSRADTNIYIFFMWLLKNEVTKLLTDL